MKNVIRSIVCLSVGCNLLIVKDSHADIVLRDGDCIGYPTASWIGSNTAEANLDSFANQDLVEISEALVSISKDHEIFCRCDRAEARKWGNKSAYSSEQNIVTIGGHHFIEVPAIDGSSLPFYVGTSINHKNIGFVSVPTESLDGLGNTACTNAQSYDGYEGSGRISGPHPALRSLKLVISPKRDNMEPGSYNFAVPTVVSHRMLVDPNAGSVEWPDLPETQMTFTNVNINIYGVCSITGNEIFEVDLGAVESSAFDTPDENGKPAGYVNKPININFECNGDSTNKIDFYLTDGNDATNSADFVTTDLTSVGVAIEHDSERLNMSSRYNDDIGLNDAGIGALNFEAYPVKVGDEPVAIGTYKAKATLVIENN